jgi:hypothetical protein
MNNTYFVSEKHKEIMEAMIKKSPKQVNDKQWSMASYLLAHPDILPHLEEAVRYLHKDEIESVMPFKWYFDGDMELGSAAHGLFELARHLFTGGRNEFSIDRYLYKWDGVNFEVAMSLIRIAKQGLSYPRPLSELIAEGRIG